MLQLAGTCAVHEACGSNCPDLPCSLCANDSGLAFRMLTRLWLVCFTTAAGCHCRALSGVGCLAVLSLVAAVLVCCLILLL